MSEYSLEAVNAMLDILILQSASANERPTALLKRQSSEGRGQLVTKDRVDVKGTNIVSKWPTKNCMSSLIHSIIFQDLFMNILFNITLFFWGECFVTFCMCPQLSMV